MKKPHLIMLLFVVAFFLPQCARYQHWPAYENQAELKLVELRESIGRGVATGQITSAEADDLLGRLDILRSQYHDLQGEATTEEPWEDYFERLEDLEEDIDEAMTDDGQVIGLTPIPRKIAILQNRIDKGMQTGALSRTQAHELQVELDDIRLDYLEEEPAGMSAIEQEAFEERIEDLEDRIDLVL